MIVEFREVLEHNKRYSIHMRAKFSRIQCNFTLHLSTGCFIRNKNRRKAIFNWAAKGLFFLKGGGDYTHSGYHKTFLATIACNRISCETET